jgi:hypothetical protein
MLVALFRCARRALPACSLLGNEFRLARRTCANSTNGACFQRAHGCRGYPVAHADPRVCPGSEVISAPQGPASVEHSHIVAPAASPCNQLSTAITRPQIATYGFTRHCTRAMSAFKARQRSTASPGIRGFLRNRLHGQVPTLSCHRMARQDQMRCHD